MRHFIVSAEGLEYEASVKNKIRAVPIPSDKNILSYYKFEKDWQNFDSFYYLSTA